MPKKSEIHEFCKKCRENYFGTCGWDMNLGMLIKERGGIADCPIIIILAWS